MASKGLETIVIHSAGHSDTDQSRRVIKGRGVEISYYLATDLGFHPELACLRTVFGIDFPVFVFVDFVTLNAHIDGRLRQYLGYWRPSEYTERWTPVLNSTLPPVGRIFIVPVDPDLSLGDDANITLVIDVATRSYGGTSG